jgi:hypothetical protein
MRLLKNLNLAQEWLFQKIAGNRKKKNRFPFAGITRIRFNGYDLSPFY